MAPESQAETKPLTSTYGSLPTPEEPSPECGSKTDPPIAGPNNPIGFPGAHGRGETIKLVDYRKIIHETLYLDRVEFRGMRCKDRLFLTAIQWTIDVVEQENRDEKEFPGEHGRGKTIDRVDYQKIIHESEMELQEKSTLIIEENQAYVEPSASTHGSPPITEQPSLGCGNGKKTLQQQDPMIQLRQNKTHLI
ncbi:hypothetical protein Cgig2_017510 [Carnegiea gigantea]|uniref:Uncharacterized protein n=1 Tax=Carnegiea gigantea TaxID=171969 RepID=A0A9Q1K3P4_9CARY|nr:hypothetical protein Cgig2_017510 [Carnegiea gigantea]